MLFNSIPFLIFLPTVFILYWFVFKHSLKYQNLLLLAASYFFYGWWDYRFLSLIALSTLVDFIIGLALNKEDRNRYRKLFIVVSLVFNLGLLGVFKYYNFFIDSWMDFGAAVGLHPHLETMQTILPVGISFYTFQTLSYSIDVYRRRIEPTSDFIQFAAYVSFFPQLVAGPIERASNLLPQFQTKRKFTYSSAKDGIQLIIWGLFQKIVIADNCATFVNAIFRNHEKLNSLTLILGAIYFAFQIYGDFAGYSNIAIGTGKLFGFRLMRNFNYPYFSRDVAEFWRRWHISLSTWFRDYLYIPLGGSRGGKIQQVRNIFIIFLVSALWHGAAWTFVSWGTMHAIFFLPLLLTNSHRKNLHPIATGKNSFRAVDLFKIMITFSLVCTAWVFFRSPTIKDAYTYLKNIFHSAKFNIEYLSIERYSVEMIALIMLFVLTEWIYRAKEHPLGDRNHYFKTIFAIFFILIFGVFSQHSTFIYFQF